jgi:hypothetical protein
MYYKGCFTTILNRFLSNFVPAEEVVVEYYIYALQDLIAMFVKREGKNTLVGNFEEAKDVEKYILSLVGNLGN